MLRRLLPVVAVALLAGCSGDPAPATTTPTEDTRATSPTSEAAPRPTTAPPIAEPLDMGPGYRHPCDTLTAGQQTRLGFRPRGKEKADDSLGRCDWGTSYVLQLHVGFDALADAYRDSGDPKWAVFEPREVRGMPAVMRAPSAQGGTCEVVVGMAPDQAVVLTGNTKPDPALCDRLVNAAGQVVDTVSRWAGV